jgi:hypothetical protein
MAKREKMGVLDSGRTATAPTTELHNIPFGSSRQKKKDNNILLGILCTKKQYTGKFYLCNDCCIQHILSSIYQYKVDIFKLGVL